MGAPSCEESDRERNLDYRITALVLEDRFRPGNVWCASQASSRRGPSEAEKRRMRQAEVEARRIEAKTGSFAADMRFFYDSMSGVVPLRRR
jgi:hypothetical protein